MPILSVSYYRYNKFTFSLRCFEFNFYYLENADTVVLKEHLNGPCNRDKVVSKTLDITLFSMAAASRNFLKKFSIIVLKPHFLIAAT